MAGIFNRVAAAAEAFRRPRASGFRAFFQDAPAGVRVDSDSAMSVPAILTCVRVLAESIATLPLDLKVREPDGTVRKAKGERLHELVRTSPNPEQTAYEFRLWLMQDALLRSAGYAQVVRDMNRDILELWPLEARNVRPMRTPDGAICFKYGADIFADSEILRVQILPGGGIIGQALIDVAGGALGCVKAAEDAAGEYFANASSLSGFVEVPGEMTDEQFERFKRDFEQRHTGSGKRHRTLVLEGGAKFNAVTLDATEAQLLETRKFNRSTVAGLFRVPAHLIGDLEKATFSNIEHQNLSFIQHSLRAWLTNWTQRLDLTLLTKEQRAAGHYYDFNLGDLLRGDLPSRIEALSKGITCGLYTINEARRIEDLPPVEGGDKTLVQGALRPVTEPYKQTATPSQ